MANDPVNIYASASRALPALTAEGGTGPVRMTHRGELVAWQLGKPLYGACDEGGYFTAVNPTVGTGIAGIAAADGYSAIETLFLLYNSSTVAERTRLYLDYIEIHNTVVDTAGTNIRVDCHIDTGDRFSSGGTAITPANMNTDSTASAKGRLRFGAVVSTAASSSVRQVYGKALSTTDIVVEDVIRFEFGNSGGAASPASVLHQVGEGTTGRVWVLPCPPVVLGANSSFLMAVDCASQSGAATWAFNSGWFER